VPWENLLGVARCIDCGEGNATVHHLEIRLIGKIDLSGSTTGNSLGESYHRITVDARSWQHGSLGEASESGESEKEGHVGGPSDELHNSHSADKNKESRLFIVISFVN
jgi:hypothetical protein